MIRLRSDMIAGAIVATVMLTGFAHAQDDISVIDVRDAIHQPERTPEGPVATTGEIVVNNNGDATDATPGDGICETATGNNICTLRAAVAEANAAAAHDLITFDPAVILIQVSGQISITSTMTVSGNAPTSPAIQNTAPLSTTSRVFNISNVVVHLNRLLITGGNVTGSGGGVLNAGTLTITNCVIEGNNANGASGIGGGIRSTNTLTIMNSTISGNASIAGTSGGLSFAGAELIIGYSTIAGNSSFGNGGGMNISATVAVNIRNSTISNNTAGASSGGFFTNRGVIVHTTISGNTANGALATDGGGGVRIQAGAGNMTFLSCTITGNSAPNSAAGARSGIWLESGSLQLLNSIVAANAAQDIQRDGTGAIQASDFNLIGENTSVELDFPAGLPAGTNYVGTNAAPLDPALGPLTNNGGRTKTHALIAGSQAIDKGQSFSSLGDQRGFFRVVDHPEIPNAPTGNGGDIGAYEFGSTPGVIVSIAGQVVESGGARPISRARVGLTDSQGTSISAVTNPFGYFRFDGLAYGETYIVLVKQKGYRPHLRSVTPEMDLVISISLDQ